MDGSLPSSPQGYAADPSLFWNDAEEFGPSDELVEVLCSLPQLPTLPAATVRPNLVLAVTSFLAACWLILGWLPQALRASWRITCHRICSHAPHAGHIQSACRQHGCIWLSTSGQCCQAAQSTCAEPCPRQVCTVGWLLLRLLPLRLVSGRRGRHLPLSARGHLEGVLAAARDDFTAELNGAIPSCRIPTGPCQAPLCSRSGLCFGASERSMGFDCTAGLVHVRCPFSCLCQRALCTSPMLTNSA